jgi:hypothetical protein
MCQIDCTMLKQRHRYILKLHASRWAKILQENQYWKKCTKILRKVKTFKIKVIFYMSCSVLDWFCSVLSPYLYWLNAVRADFAYVGHFFVIFLDCKCWLQYVNYFICPPNNILLSNTFPKFSWSLTWIWRCAALNENCHTFSLLKYSVNNK